MDRRALLFVIAVTAAFFFVSLFFTHSQQEKKKEWLVQRKAYEAKQQKLHEEEIVRRTVPVTRLPLARVYGDQEGGATLSVGVWQEGRILTLAWTDHLPTTIWTRPIAGSSSEALKPLSLLTEPSAAGDPVLYGEKGTVSAASVEELGRTDVQLVRFWRDATGEHLTVTLGEYVNGRFRLVGVSPGGDALALMKEGETYLPVGIYRESGENIQLLADFASLENFLKVVESEVSPSVATQEHFFVLENAYQQLVFSNRGGALVELNLPFQSDSHPSSVVRKIGIDEKILEQHPADARFPSVPYFTPGNSPTGPFRENAQGTLGGYYPLLRRSLVSAKEKRPWVVPASTYGFNLVSEYPEVAELIYEVKEFDSQHIVFQAVQPHRRITKTYTLSHDPKGAPYCLSLEVSVDGDSNGLWLTTGVPEVELLSGASSPTLKYRLTRQNKPDVETISLPKDSLTVTSVEPDWICNSNGFFGFIVDPVDKVVPGYMVQYVAGLTCPSRLVLVDSQSGMYSAADFPGYNMLLPLRHNGGTMHFRIFAGPFAESILTTVDATVLKEQGVNPDYIACQSFHGWFAFISEPFAQFLLILMKFFHYLTGSWAFSIILLTAALRLMLYPLNAWSLKSMRRMQILSPELAKVQEKYKKDPKRLQLEVVNLYRTHRVNPMSGCFPLLVQLPFLIGMFDLLKSTYELRGASFIPGWIDNLTAPDVLFSWQTPLPLIGNEFHLLPFILGAVTYLQQRMTSPMPKDASKLTDQQRQQKAMATIMPLLFTVMFYKVASGLNIYWLSSMVFGILQQWFTNWQMKAPEKSQ